MLGAIIVDPASDVGSPINTLSVKLLLWEENFQAVIVYFAIMAYSSGNAPPTSAAMMQFSEEIIKQLTPEEIDEFREAFMMFDKVSVCLKI